MWDARLQETTDNITQLLVTRFGTELQVERFKAELCAHQRNHMEPLQQLY